MSFKTCGQIDCSMIYDLDERYVGIKIANVIY